ncbi:MAG: hypothetical protein JXA44_08520 [Methanospirillaceae archaeon]|nr:hypothetical protein [Methanospirillaceae archaeon]
MQIEEIIEKIPLENRIPDSSSHLYIFGRNPVLSFAELQSLCIAGNRTKEKGKSDIQTGSCIDISPYGCITTAPEAIPVSQSGSLLKSAVPFSYIMKSDHPVRDKEHIIAIADELVRSLPVADKCHWCISAYNEMNERDAEYFDLFQKAIKEALKNQGIKKCTYVPPQEDLDRVRAYDDKKTYQGHTVLPQKIQSKKIREEGFECILWHMARQSGNTLIVAFLKDTIDVTGFEERDTKRPYTRSKLGLGGALARTMVNLAGVPKGTVLYDPFCGTGIILQEALLSGLLPLGSDIDESCVTGARNNLAWIAKKENRNRFDIQKVFSLDVTRAATHFSPGSIPAIVTEPYLGPALTRYPEPGEAKTIRADLNRRYDQYLAALSPVLAEGGKMVVIFPQIRTRDGNRHSLDIRSLVSRNGLAIYHLFIHDLRIPCCFIHAPKGQRVERVITVLTKA